jgi:hypothetical protein
MAMLLTMVLSVYLFNVRATVQVGECIFFVSWSFCLLPILELHVWRWYIPGYVFMLIHVYHLCFAAFLGHSHLHNFPADVFYACAHASRIATNIASYIKVGMVHCYPT